MELRLDENAIGFDLDHTLVRYTTKFNEVLFETLKMAMIQLYDYPAQLFKNISFHSTYASRGFVFDMKTGNFLLVSHLKHVVHVFHGTGKIPIGSEKISKEEENSLLNTHIYAGPISELGFESKDIHHSDRFYSLVSSYNPSAIHILALMVDYHDHQKQNRITPNQNQNINDIENDNEYAYLIKRLVEGYRFAFDRAEPPEGPMYDQLLSHKEIENFVMKRVEIRKWLVKLREKGVILFLVTNSYFIPANKVMSVAYGEDWRTLFDFVVVEAKKPKFFSTQSLFVEYDVSTGAKKTEEQMELIEKGKVYCFGCSKYLESSIREYKKASGEGDDKKELRIVYFGDNLLTDVMATKLFTTWKPVAVVEEMEEEFLRIQNRNLSEEDLDQGFEKMNKWGSMFEYGNTKSYWYNFICLHSVLCVPDVTVVAKEDFGLQPHLYDFKSSMCFYPSIQ